MTSSFTQKTNHLPVDEVYSELMSQYRSNEQTGQGMTWTEQVEERNGLFKPLLPRSCGRFIEALDRQGVLRPLVALRLVEKQCGATGLTDALLKEAVQPTLSAAAEEELAKIAALPDNTNLNEMKQHAKRANDIVFSPSTVWYRQRQEFTQLTHLTPAAKMVQDIRNNGEWGTTALLSEMRPHVIGGIDAIIAHVASEKGGVAKV